MTFGKRLTQLREENGYNTRKKFAEKLSIPETTLRNYETDAREPGHTFLKQMSDFFNVSADYLLGLTEEKEKFSSHQLRFSEMEHIKKYRALDDSGREHVDTILQWESDRVKQLDQATPAAIVELHKAASEKGRLIEYFRSVSAGTGQVIFDDVYSERITMPDILEYRRVAYAVKVDGRSMEPLYNDGDILLIEPTCEIAIGEIGIFNVNGQAYVKQLGQDRLISLNKEYNDIPLTEDSVCMGRVVDKLDLNITAD